MLKIQQRFIDRVRKAERSEDLYEMVQGAIELEHATIPTYLCAYLTLKLGTNQTVGEILRSVFVEEMLHMSLVSNLMIAIGGKPEINKPEFIPKYPGPLPMGIAKGLIVPLEKCTVELVRDVFMKIEEPEDPIPIMAAPSAGEVEWETIGEFYKALDKKLRELGQPAFKGNFDREMLDHTWFPKGQLFRIDGPDSASRAIYEIVRQGEGTKWTPLDRQGEPAHYYRFEQIVKGRRLVRDREAPSGFRFDGAPVTLERESVWNMEPNPDPDTLPEGSAARRASVGFAYAYTCALNALHDTFNGHPEHIGTAMGLMYQLRILAQGVLSTPLPDQPDVSTGLSFRYQPTTTYRATDTGATR